MYLFYARPKNKRVFIRIIRFETMCVVDDNAAVGSLGMVSNDHVSASHVLCVCECRCKGMRVVILLDWR